MASATSCAVLDVDTSWYIEAGNTLRQRSELNQPWFGSRCSEPHQAPLAGSAHRSWMQALQLRQVDLLDPVARHMSSAPGRSAAASASRLAWASSFEHAQARSARPTHLVVVLAHAPEGEGLQRCRRRGSRSPRRIGAGDGGRAAAPQVRRVVHRRQICRAPASRRGSARTAQAAPHRALRARAQRPPGTDVDQRRPDAACAYRRGRRVAHGSVQAGGCGRRCRAAVARGRADARAAFAQEDLERQGQAPSLERLGLASLSRARRQRLPLSVPQPARRVLSRNAVSAMPRSNAPSDSSPSWSPASMRPDQRLGAPPVTPLTVGDAASLLTAHRDFLSTSIRYRT